MESTYLYLFLCASYHGYIQRPVLPSSSSKSKTGHKSKCNKQLISLWEEQRHCRVRKWWSLRACDPVERFVVDGEFGLMLVFEMFECHIAAQNDSESTYCLHFLGCDALAKATSRALTKISKSIGISRLSACLLRLFPLCLVWCGWSPWWQNLPKKFTSNTVVCYWF